jgi:hypothetical protein
MVFLLVKKHANIRKIEAFQEFNNVFLQEFINTLNRHIS